MYTCIHSSTCEENICKCLAAVKQRGRSEGGDPAGFMNTGLRRSRGIWVKLCQVKRSSLWDTESAECEGIKTSPRLVCTLYSCDWRVQQTVYSAHLLRSPEYNWHFLQPRQGKEKLPPKHWPALPSTLPVKTRQTRSDRFLWQIPKKSFKAVFIWDYKQF